MARRLGAKAAADHVGVGYSTWRSLRARGKAPAPDGIDESFGKEYWLPSTLDKWMSSRPGQGARTDLKDKPRGKGATIDTAIIDEAWSE